MIPSIAERRLRHQSITGPPRRTVEGVVSWLGAMQAQEYAVAKWGLGLRMTDGTSDATIERAFNEGRILRTHVMRPTWHFVTPSDIRWMLELTAPRVQRTMQVYNRQLELDPSTLNRAVSTIERALGASPFLTRFELSGHLANAGIHAKGQRLAHIALHAELEGVIRDIRTFWGFRSHWRCGDRGTTRAAHAFFNIAAATLVSAETDEPLTRFRRRG